MALAAAGVRRRPGRAALTVLAVTLAATLLTAMLVIAGTARTRVLDQLARGGPLSGIRVAAAEPASREVEGDDLRAGAPRPLDDAALGRMRALPGVARVLPVLTAPVMVLPPEPALPGASVRTETLGQTLVGVDLARASELPITVLAGRLPGPTSRAEVAVTEGYLERLGVGRQGSRSVIGREIQLGSARFVRIGRDTFRRGRWTRARVVGVVAQEAAPGQLLAPMARVRPAREWTAASEVRPVDVNFSTPYSGAFVVAEGLSRVTRVRQAITDLGFATSASENLIASVLRYLKVVELVLTSIGVIALVIAALGIANALLAAVRERRREIGVLKAIGARDRDVLRIFLLEAAFVGLVGGLTGTALGWGVARAVGAMVNDYLTRQGLAGVPMPLPLALLALVAAGSTLLALLAGALPARRAARLPAREAVGSL